MLILIKLLGNRILLVLRVKKSENGYCPLLQGYSPILMPTVE